MKYTHLVFLLLFPFAHLFAQINSYEPTNPDSLEVRKAYVEKWLTTRKPLDYLQFQRIGYYNVDPDSTPDHLIFNRTVGLRDNWKK